MKDLVAVILAGGSGSRFWPLSEKALFSFMGKTFFEHAVGSTLPKEVKRVVVIASPDNESFFANLKLSVPHTTVVQHEPKGMADAILAAEKNLQSSSLLVMNGDDIHRPGVYEGVLSQAKISKAFGVIPGWKTDTYRDLGYLVLDKGNIQKIVEKPGAGNEPSHFVFMVSYFVEDSNTLLDEMKKTKSDRDDVHEVALSALMQSHQFEMYEHTGGFASLKYPWDVLAVMNLLLKNLKAHKGSHVTIKSNVVIEGEVWIGDNVKIFENTKIIGPCYIGPNSIIGNNNLIRESHIGANCVTGFNTDITRSYVGNDCWFHSNYIGDSVLEGNVGMGSGAVLANLRLDEGEIFSSVKSERVNTGRNKLGAIIGCDTRIGVNVSIMPGVKIGPGSLIGAGVVLEQDLPDTSFCMLTSGGYTVTKNTRKSTTNRDKFKKHL